MTPQQQLIDAARMAVNKLTAALSRIPAVYQQSYVDQKAVLGFPYEYLIKDASESISALTAALDAVGKAGEVPAPPATQEKQQTWTCRCGRVNIAEPCAQCGLSKGYSSPLPPAQPEKPKRNKTGTPEEEQAIADMDHDNQVAQPTSPLSEQQVDEDRQLLAMFAAHAPKDEDLVPNTVKECAAYLGINESEYRWDIHYIQIVVEARMKFARAMLSELNAASQKGGK
jgi:hypothetical protein